MTLVSEEQGHVFLLPKKVTKRGIDLKRVGGYGNPDE